MDEEKNNQRVHSLITKYRNGKCSPTEIRELFSLLEIDKYDEIINAELERSFEKEFDADKVQGIKNKKIRGSIFRLKNVSVAAALIACAFVGLYYIISSQNFQSVVKTSTSTEGISPGTEQAILIAEDGNTFRLDSLTSGEVTNLSGTIASITAKGELTLNASVLTDSQAVRFNTISIPTGGFFKIILPDGSKVWLNSESALHFPSRFTGKSRLVTLTGEGYFEVTPDSHHPFRVRLSGDEEIEVLGTIFNIMAYDNEPNKKITLLEGKIRLTTKNQTALLHPSQQAIANRSDITIADQISIEHETSWKNGLFDFQDQDLPSILRQLSRWYSANISLGDGQFTGHYTGSIRKSSDIRDVLRMLEATGNVTFNVVGKNIFVHEK